MRPSRLARFLLALICSFALVGPLSVATASPASAASGYTLTAGGTRVTTSDKSAKLTVKLAKAGKSVAKATVLLQYLNGSTWKTEKKVTVKRGKGSVSVKHAVSDRRYRFSISGSASAEFVVHVVPAKFTISGSGAGHGVGMSQYGAYQLARTGATTAQILEHYYTGAVLSTANNKDRTVKVQVLGPPADSRKTTTLTVSSGGFSLVGDGKVLKTYSTPGKVLVGIKGSKVTTKVTLKNGKVKNQTLASSGRVKLTWTAGPVTVDGAQGSYKAGNLQVTVRSGRPNVINELAMNTDYLYGIDEMPASWGSAAGGGAAALRAQVIVARTYVIRRISALKVDHPNAAEGFEVDPACDCHVYDDQRSQNFTGWKKAGPAANKPWVDAVKATILGSEVQVLRGPDKGFAETPFFASSGKGGGTANNTDAFGTTALPYLVSISDPDSAGAPGNPYLSWSRTLTQAQLAKVLGTKALIRSVSVTEAYTGGLAKTISYTTSSGASYSFTRTSESWRTRLGLPGAWITKITGK